MFGWNREPSRTKTEELLDFVHSRERFRDILEVERMRSDRNGSPFALVTFSVPTDVDDATFLDFARQLERRRRATDHIGRMHDRHLGAVLWDTRESGAWTFCEDMLEGWRSNGGEHSESDRTNVEPEVEVFVYPTHTPPDGKSTITRATLDADTADEDADFGELIGVGASLASSDRTEAAIAVAPQPVRTTTAARETKSLETLFVRPLPFWKRALDIVGATFGLIVLSPLLLVVAVLVKWTSPGPVLFRQRRTGHGGREFTILKFRTMCVDAESRKAALRRQSEQDGPAFKLANDPRITAVGRILRKTAIDELPQLWNVLVGDMTLVGPRPLDVKEADQTSGWERRRLDVTPGLTCIWQVDGKSRVTFAEWMRMDIRYTRVGTFRADMRLVARTLLAMIRLKASQ